MVKKPAAVQLWTLRKEIAEDLDGTLAHVADIGYAGIELWFAEYPPVDVLKAALHHAGLRPMGAHVPFLSLRDDFDRVAAYHRALGNADLVIPVIPTDLRQTEGDWRERVVEISAIGAKCQEAGFRLSYHNHAMELQEAVDGVTVHDYILSTIGAERLQAEIDTYFFAETGRDPAAVIRKYAGRVPLLHVKDRSAGPTPGTVEVGRGVIDWDPVFAAADQAGVEWIIVEQNCQEHPALESVRMSLTFLRTQGVA